MKIEFPTQLPVPAQKEKLETLASGLVSEYLGSWRWRPDGALDISFAEPSKAAGISGVVTPGAGKIEIELDLPLRFRLFAGRIESGIREKLLAALGAPASPSARLLDEPLVKPVLGLAALGAIAYAAYRLFRR